MALTSQAGMTFGSGLRVTDTGGGCISYATSPIGTDAEFTGPDFSMGYRFRKINTSTSGTSAVGIADVNGTFRRFWLQAEANSGANLIFCSLQIDATGGAQSDVVLAQISEDTDEHSVAVTYDGDGDTLLYIDGELVDEAATVPIDISGPADGTDVFSIWGSTSPGIEVYYVDNSWFHNTVISPGQVASIHTDGLAGDS